MLSDEIHRCFSRNTTRSNYSIKRELSAQIEREFMENFNLQLEDEETVKINRNYLLSPFRSGYGKLMNVIFTFIWFIKNFENL